MQKFQKKKQHVKKQNNAVKTAVIFALVLFSVPVLANNHIDRIPKVYHDLSIKDLKGLFKSCDAASQKTLLGQDEAAHCSYVYELLLHKEFGGQFSKFMEWYKVSK